MSTAKTTKKKADQGPKNPVNWFEKSEVIVTDEATFTVSRWTGQDADDPFGLEVSFSVEWVAWQGTEKEELRKETATTTYGMSIDELDALAWAIHGICARLRGGE